MSLCVYIPLADLEPFSHLLGTEYIVGKYLMTCQSRLNNTQ